MTRATLTLGPGEQLTLARCPVFARLLSLAWQTGDSMLPSLLTELTLASKAKRAPSARAALRLADTPLSDACGTLQYCDPQQATLLMFGDGK
jgi:hypothetical protein